MQKRSGALWLMLFMASTGPAECASASEANGGFGRGGQQAGAPSRDDSVRPVAQVSPDRLMNTVRELSKFDGRQSGTPGGEAAARYIAAQLPEATLQSVPVKILQVSAPVGSGGGSSGTGPPPAVIKAQIQRGNHVKPLENGSDFLPILNGASTHLVAVPVLFVGYGIADQAQGLDEYEGLSAAGKVVLFLRGQPKGYAGRATHTDKARTAQAKGAVACLTVTGPVLSSYEKRRGISQQPMALYEEETAKPLPGLWITAPTAELLLEPTGMTLESFQHEMDRLPKKRSTETGSKLTLGMEQHQVAGTAPNVLALWPGSDPDLGHQIIILGAHYDHFGIQGGLMFPGADDNASGTAVILEVARLFAQEEIKAKRSILFIAFAGEEQGLVGSRFYVSHPLEPISQTKAMVNVDHAGAGNGRITIGLSGIGKQAAQAAADKIGIGEQIELFGYFPGGDHVPFVEARVPTAAIVSSGAHPNFHRPSDTADMVDPEILASVTRYTLSLLLALANEGLEENDQASGKIP
jgi:hypothetical protein